MDDPGSSAKKIQSCENYSNAELVKGKHVDKIATTGDENTRSLDNNPIKNNGTDERSRPSGSDEDNLMAQHHNDSQLNAYDDGPGAVLPQEQQRGALANNSNEVNRLECEIFVNNIHKALTKKGITALCNKFGRVKSVRKRDNHNFAFVVFASAEDAANAIRNINELSFRSTGNARTHAEFSREDVARKDRNNHQEPHQEPQALDLPKCQTVNENEFTHPFSTPVSLDSFEPKSLLTSQDVDRLELLRQFANQPTNILLEMDQQFENIRNGRESYRHSSDADVEMKKWQTKSLGSFDAIKQELVYNDAANFCEIGNCKNCGNPTLTLCKGCKDFFCTLNCWKECKHKKSGCSCVNPEKPESKSRNLNRHVRRGGKLIMPRPISSSQSISPTPSTDSDTASPAANDAWKRRMQILRQCRDDESNRPSIVEPCAVPSNNTMVTITNVVSHKIVFLRSLEKSDNDRYVRYLNDVAEDAKTAPPLQEMPKVGDIVLAEFEGFYDRALVARIDKEDAVVAYLEFGNVEKKPMSQLKKLRDDLKYVKLFVFKARLRNVDGDLKTDKCLTYLYQLLERRVPLKFKGGVNSSEELRCELFVNVTNESVNGKLNTLNNIKPDKPVMNYDIPFKSLDSNSTCTKVVVLDNTFARNGLVTVARSEHMAELFLMHQRIEEYCKDDYESPYTPRPDEICLAKCSNGRWYRAERTAGCGDQSPVMHFVDFFIYNKVHINDMRPMPTEFKIPLYSVFAEIGGTTETEQFRLLSEVTVTKVENDDQGEQKIYVNFSETVDSNATPPKYKRRQQFLRNLHEKSNPDVLK